MTDYPKITLVTPTKNSEKFLEETILSVIEQDYPNLEYIIIDGCSTDKTIDIIKQYEKYLSYWESSPDKTMYDAIAKGFDRATGEILGWINSDDLLEPGCLQKVGGHFIKNPKHQVIYFENIVIKDGWWVPNRPHVNVGLGELLDCYIIYQDGVFFTREAYESIGGLNRDLFVAGDYDLWLRLSRRYRLHRSAGHLSCFRLIPGQLSMSNWQRYITEVVKCRDDLKTKLTPFELKKAELAKKLRRFPNRILNRYRLNLGRVWPIANENLKWTKIIEQPYVSIRECKCPVCGKHPDRLLFSSPNTDNGNRRIWRVYECKDCSLSFPFPKPDMSDLLEINEQKIPQDNEGKTAEPDPELYSPYKGRTLNYVFLKWLHKLLPLFQSTEDFLINQVIHNNKDLNSVILDIGCSEGQVLEKLRKHGYKNLFGVEINKKAADIASSKGFIVNTGEILADWPYRHVDTIILNKMLERVSDPIGFLSSISRFLSSRGCIHLGLTNYDSAFIDFYGPAWAHWHIPYHIFIPSRKTIKKIAEKSGYEAKWFKTTTSVHNAYMSEALSRVGLGGYISPNIDTAVPGFEGEWEMAKGVTVASRFFLDPLLRGDCLYAQLVKRHQ